MENKTNLIKITPYGFCNGVILAYNKTLKIINQYPNYKIFLVGWLVHNEQVMNKLTAMGVKILDDNNKTRLALIKSIPKAAKTIVIFSAHGTQIQAINLAINKGFLVFDLTCPYVTKIAKLINEKIIKGFLILYIGEKNHPEAKAIKAISPKKIFIINCEEDIIKLKIKNDQKIFVTNQTTMSYDEYEKINLVLKNKFGKIEFANGICQATDLRIHALKKSLIKADLLIVVGSKKSHNCYKLYKLGLKNKVDSYLVENADRLDLLVLKNKHEIRVASGTSTPKEITDEVINKIKKYTTKGSI